MELSRTTLEIYRHGQRFVRPAGTNTGVSLHSHSDCSRESLEYLPSLARRMPLLAMLFERGVAAYQRDQGRQPDFAAIYWRPPVTPAGVIESEREQIAERFDCTALVSLTDHDSVEGPLKLRAIGASEVLLSFEWTVPVEESVLHLGVHAIPPDRLEAAMRLTREYSRGAARSSLREIFAWLVERRDTFIVLNHPFWDVGGVGELRHEAMLLAFLHAYRPFIHALELNGYRSWQENRRVLPLSEGFGLPVVTGGDRHGCSPNSMINLSRAGHFEQFAADLRAGRRTNCVIFPEYSEPLPARMLQSAREALGHAVGRRGTWCDRVFWESENGVEMSLASTWPTGGPLWLRGAIELTRLLGSRPMRPVLRLTLSKERT